MIKTNTQTEIETKESMQFPMLHKLKVLNYDTDGRDGQSESES